MGIRRVGEKFRVAHGYDKNGWKLTRPTAVYECECGERFIMQCRSESGTQSCGCLAKETARQLLTGNTHLRTHGMTGSPTYNTWVCMRGRCYDTNHIEYHRYGAKGITVCDRWLSFENFYEDMGDRPAGKTIDRIRGTENYTPENCRWATKTEQARNKVNNVLVEIDGVTKTVAEWCEHPEADLDKTVYKRIKSGKTGRQAVFGSK